jgi:hypothetical protein
MNPEGREEVDFYVIFGFQPYKTFKKACLNLTNAIIAAIPCNWGFGPLTTYATT